MMFHVFKCDTHIMFEVLGCIVRVVHVYTHTIKLVKEKVQ